MKRRRAKALGLSAALLGAGAQAAEAPARPAAERPAAESPARPPAQAPAHPQRFLGPPVRDPHAAPALQRAPAPGGARVDPVRPAGSPALPVRAPGDPVLPARAPLDAVAGDPALAPYRLADPVPPPTGPQHPLAPQAGSPEALARVRVTLRTIAARRAGETLEIDGRLRAIDRDLRSFAEQFNYKVYQLLDEQTLDLDFQRPTQVDLPGQRSLQLQPTGLLRDGRVRLHLELLGPTPGRERKMHTDYSLPRGRTILVGGYRVDPDRPESGTLLLAITQAE